MIRSVQPDEANSFESAGHVRHVRRVLLLHRSDPCVCVRVVSLLTACLTWQTRRRYHCHPQSMVETRDATSAHAMNVYSEHDTGVLL
jgi:hypothetical protein